MKHLSRVSLSAILCLAAKLKGIVLSFRFTLYFLYDILTWVDYLRPKV